MCGPPDDSYDTVRCTIKPTDYQSCVNCGRIDRNPTNKICETCLCDYIKNGIHSNWKEQEAA